MDSPGGSDGFPRIGEEPDCPHVHFDENPSDEPRESKRISAEASGISNSVGGLGGVLFSTRSGAPSLEVYGPAVAKTIKGEVKAKAKTSSALGVRSTILPKSSSVTLAIRQAQKSGLFLRSLNEALVVDAHVRFCGTHKLGIIKGFTVCWNCGAYTSNFRCHLLKHPCRNIFESREGTLTRLANGKLPPGHKKWPEDK
jgi:hypothetical protein